MIYIAYILVTFLIVSLSFLAGLKVGRHYPTGAEDLEKALKTPIKILPEKKGDVGGVRAPTKAEVDRIRDKEFRENFPQVG